MLKQALPKLKKSNYLFLYNKEIHPFVFYNNKFVIIFLETTYT